MKKLVIIALAFLPALAFASDIKLDKANYDQADKASLQNGAKLFMNYCSACHSTQYQRYNRVAEDLEIPVDVMQANLMFTGADIGDLMHNAIPDKDAANWFGAPPPDLTLTARVRGADWLYTYLRSFYKDDSRPFGVNNLVFPSVGMPHVLEPLQGSAVLVTETRTVKGEEVEVAVGTRVDSTGELTAEEYDDAVLDIVNFLVYSGDPVKLERHRIGYWVLGFLAIFFVIAYLLKREYWRDVH